MVLGVNIDKPHLSKIIGTWFHNAGWVTVPLAEVVGTEFTIPTLRE
jgi:hypothetical protein